jgi:hypothetical protein
VLDVVTTPDGKRWSLQLGGVSRVIPGTDPAANVEISEAVPANRLWLVRSVWAQLVTDGTAATRVVELVIDDGTQEFKRFPAVTGHAASLTRQYTWAPVGAGQAPPGATTTGMVGIFPPDLYLPAGFRIRTVTTNRQAGDNYAAPQLWVVEFSSN